MILASKVLIVLVALLHCYFLVLEMFLWTQPIGLKVFRQTKTQAEATALLAANQGLYNGFLALGLLWSLVHHSPHFARELQYFFLACVIAAGIYGAYSVNKKIFFVQALPAIIAFVLTLLS